MRLIRRRRSTAFANIFYTNFFAARSLPPPPSGTHPPPAANSAARTKSSALAASAAPGYSGQRTSPLIFAPESSYEVSLAIRERLAKADPNNTGRQRALSVSQDRIGDVHMLQG